MLGHPFFNFNTRRWLRELQCQLGATGKVDTKLEAAQRCKRNARDDDSERQDIPACTLRNHLELWAEEVIGTPLLEHLWVWTTALAMRQQKQECTCDRDSGEHRERNTNQKCQRKSAYSTGSKVVKQEAGNSGTHVRVEDGAERTSKSGRDSCTEVLAIP